MLKVSENSSASMGRGNMNTRFYCENLEIAVMKKNLESGSIFELDNDT